LITQFEMLVAERSWPCDGHHALNIENTALTLLLACTFRTEGYFDIFNVI